MKKKSCHPTHMVIANKLKKKNNILITAELIKICKYCKLTENALLFNAFEM